MSRGDSRSNSLARVPEQYLSWMWPSTRTSPAHVYYPISKVSAQGLWEFAGQKQNLVMPKRTFPLPAECSGRGSPVFSVHQPPYLAMLAPSPELEFLYSALRSTALLCPIRLLQGYSPKSCTPRTFLWFMLPHLCVIHLITAFSRHSYMSRCIIKSNKYSLHAHTHLLQKAKDDKK